MANGDKEEKDAEKRRPLTRSEKVRNYLIGLGAASALILGLIAQFKGEPVAEKTWTTLRKRMNELSENMHKLHLRMVHLQGVGEGYNAGKLAERLNQLQRKYDALKASSSTASAGSVASKKPTAVAVAPPKSPLKCKDGHIEIEGRCKRVARAVAKRVNADAKAAAAAQARLVAEQKRRMALERKKAAMIRKMQAQKVQAQSVKKLIPLPAKLDDAK